MVGVGLMTFDALVARRAFEGAGGKFVAYRFVVNQDLNGNDDGPMAVLLESALQPNTAAFTFRNLDTSMAYQDQPIAASIRESATARGLYMIDVPTPSGRPVGDFADQDLIKLQVHFPDLEPETPVVSQAIVIHGSGVALSRFVQATPEQIPPPPPKFYGSRSCVTISGPNGVLADSCAANPQFVGFSGGRDAVAVALEKASLLRYIRNWNSYQLSNAAPGLAATMTYLQTLTCAIENPGTTAPFQIPGFTTIGSQCATSGSDSGIDLRDCAPFV